MPLATPTLAVLDNGNLTATATITVGDAGATNTLYSQAVDGELGGSVWTSRGSRTGNGTITTAALTASYFWWKVVSTLGAETVTSNLIYRNLADAAEAIHKRLLDGVKARIQSLTLSGLNNNDVLIRWLPQDRETEQRFPFVLVCPVGTENDIGNTNAKDELGYPVQVGIVDAANQDVDANFNKYLLWRQKLDKAFRHQRLAGVDEVNNCEIERMPVVNAEMFKENLFVSGMVLRFFVRAGRGI